MSTWWQVRLLIKLVCIRRTFNSLRLFWHFIFMFIFQLYIIFDLVHAELIIAVYVSFVWRACVKMLLTEIVLLMQWCGRCVCRSHTWSRRLGSSAKGHMWRGSHRRHFHLRRRSYCLHAQPTQLSKFTTATSASLQESQRPLPWWFDGHDAWFTCDVAQTCFFYILDREFKVKWKILI